MQVDTLWELKQEKKAEELRERVTVGLGLHEGMVAEDVQVSTAFLLSTFSRICASSYGFARHARKRNHVQHHTCKFSTDARKRSLGRTWGI